MGCWGLHWHALPYWILDLRKAADKTHACKSQQPTPYPARVQQVKTNKIDLKLLIDNN